MQLSLAIPVVNLRVAPHDALEGQSSDWHAWKKQSHHAPGQDSNSLRVIAWVLHAHQQHLPPTLPKNNKPSSSRSESPLTFSKSYSTYGNPVPAAIAQQPSEGCPNLYSCTALLYLTDADTKKGHKSYGRLGFPQQRHAADVPLGNWCRSRRMSSRYCLRHVCDASDQE